MSFTNLGEIFAMHYINPNLYIKECNNFRMGKRINYSESRLMIRILIGFFKWLLMKYSRQTSTKVNRAFKPKLLPYKIMYVHIRTCSFLNLFVSFLIFIWKCCKKNRRIVFFQPWINQWILLLTVISIVIIIAFPKFPCRNCVFIITCHEPIKNSIYGHGVQQRRWLLRRTD